MENPPQSFEVCIVCALPEEARLFLEVLQQQCEGILEERMSPRYQYSYRFATIKNNKDEPLNLHISWLPRYGPQEMTLHLSRVLEECQPRIAIMTGICAGDSQHVQLGDLVVAERTFTYDNGKFTLDEHGRSVHEHDTLTYQLDANILQFLGLFDDWKPLIGHLERPPSPPEISLKQREVRCHIKAMASGSAVRADHPFEDVRASVRGMVAIDMEGAAFGLVMSRHPLIPWLVVKGVCDYADQDKNDAYHDYAARASALYVLSFIQDYVTHERLPRPHSSSPSTQAESSGVWNVPHSPNPPNEFYSCFISYSNHDQDIAERLYEDLRSSGVHCWFAPHHMKIGDKIRSSIDESIRTYDKLLLILSKHSVASQWVETEVEAAFERERQQNKLVLFPIRLDGTVMQATQSWAAEIRRTRHIGDFTRWENHSYYRQAFTRLLHDLEAEPFSGQRESVDAQNTVTNLSTQVADLRRSVPIVKTPRRISRRVVLIGGVAVGLGLVGGGVTLFTHLRTPMPSIAVGTRLNYFEDTGAIRALAWSRDGRFIASANDDDTVPVWDVQANKLIYTCRGHSDHVEGVSWSPDGKYIVSGSADGTARIWDAQTAKTRSIYSGHTEVDVGSHHPWVNRVQWSPDGTRIVSCDQTSSGSNTATVKVWVAKTGKTLVTYSEHKNGVYSVVWSPNNKSIASVGYDGILRVWDANSGKTLVAISESYPRWLFGVAWSPDSNRVAFGGTDYTVWVISLDGQQKVALYTLPHSQGLGIRDLAWSPKGKYIAVSTHYQGVYIIQSDTGTLVYANSNTLVGDISALGWSLTNARIASGNGFSDPIQVPAVQVWQAPME